MATLQNFTTSGIPVTQESGGYLIELPAGTTPEQANAMINDGLTDNNWGNAGVEVRDVGGKPTIFIPTDQLDAIDGEEFGLFKYQYDALKPATPIPATPAAAVAAVTATPDEKRFGELMTEFAKNGALSDEKALEAKKIAQKIGVDKATEIAKASGAEGALNEEQKKEAQKDLTDFERDLPEEKKNAKKSKRDIVSEMIAEGNILGAIMAMLFMVDDPEKTVSEKIAQTKEAITSGKPVEPEKAVEAGTPAAAKTEEAGKEAEGAKKDEVKLSPEKENDKNIYIAKLEAEQKLADAEAKLAKLKAGFTEKTPEEVDKLTLDEKKAYNAAKNEVQKAQGEVEMLKDDAATYKTSHDKAAEAENAKLKEDKKTLEAEIKALKEKAVGLDKDKELTKDKLDALIEKRGGVSKEGKGGRDDIDIAINAILLTNPEFKDEYTAQRVEQDKQITTGIELMKKRYQRATVGEGGYIDPNMIEESNKDIRALAGKDENGKPKTLLVDVEKGITAQDDRIQKAADAKVEAAAKVAADAKAKEVAAANAVEDKRVQTATVSVTQAVSGIDSVETINGKPGNYMLNTKDNYVDANDVNFDKNNKGSVGLNNLKAKVAALDGNAGDISKDDVEKFAAILNDLQNAKGVSSEAKKILTDTIQPTVAPNNKAPAKGAGVGSRE